MLKKLAFVILFSSLFTQFSFANNYIRTNISGYTFKVIKYDTKSKDYIFKIWARQDYQATSLRELMEENNWVSAINWVFFCPESYRECGWKNFTKNERYVEWKKISNIQLPNTESTWDRVVFAVSDKNEAFLYQTDKINSEDEEKIYYGFSNFPLLLQNGISKYDDYVKLGLVDSKMEAKINRNFICSDESWRYIYSGYISNIKLKNVPGILLEFGCYNALNLDAGGSGAMIYNSKYIVWPSRNILDWVIIERKNLDTKKIIERSEKILLFLEERIKDKSNQEKIEYYNTLNKGLSKIKSSIYEENSIDLIDEESWEIIWYEIEIKDIKKISTLYLINYLDKLFYEINNVYKEKIKQEELELKNKNAANWLF